MDDKKDDAARNGEEQFSDYEDMLSGLSAEDDEAPSEGKSEDRDLLSELLEGVDAQDDREEPEKKKSGRGMMNLDAIDNLDFESLTSGVDADSDDDSQAMSTGKFEIEVDDENVDYASILNEIESAVTPPKKHAAGAEMDFDDSADEDTGEIPGIGADERIGDVPEEALDESLIEELLEDLPVNEAGDSEESTPSTVLAFDEDFAAELAMDDIAESDDSLSPARVPTGELDGVDDGQDEEIEEHTTPTGEFPAIEEEDTAEVLASDDVSYTSYLSAEDRDEDDKNIIDIGPEDGADEESLSSEFVLDAEETPDDGIPSYASFIAGDDMAGSEGDGTDSDTGEKPGSFLSIEAEDYTLDEADLELAVDDLGFDLTQAGENEAAEDAAPTSTTGESIVINGGDLGGDDGDPMDFLDIDEQKTESQDDTFLGVADVREAKMPEVMLEGIEMDPAAQIAAVTRAELYLAQGQRNDAAAIYDKVARERGVSPFVAKRLKELDIDQP